MQAPLPVSTSLDFSGDDHDVRIDFHVDLLTPEPVSATRVELVSPVQIAASFEAGLPAGEHRIRVTDVTGRELSAPFVLATPARVELFAPPVVPARVGTLLWAEPEALTSCRVALTDGAEDERGALSIAPVVFGAQRRDVGVFAFRPSEAAVAVCLGGPGDPGRGLLGVSEPFSVAVCDRRPPPARYAAPVLHEVGGWPRFAAAGPMSSADLRWVDELGGVTGGLWTPGGFRGFAPFTQPGFISGIVVLRGPTGCVRSRNHFGWVLGADVPLGSTPDQPFARLADRRVAASVSSQDDPIVWEGKPGAVVEIRGRVLLEARGIILSNLALEGDGTLVLRAPELAVFESVEVGDRVAVEIEEGALLMQRGEITSAARPVVAGTAVDADGVRIDAKEAGFVFALSERLTLVQSVARFEAASLVELIPEADAQALFIVSYNALLGEVEARWIDAEGSVRGAIYGNVFRGARPVDPVGPPPGGAREVLFALNAFGPAAGLGCGRNENRCAPTPLIDEDGRVTAGCALADWIRDPDLAGVVDRTGPLDQIDVYGAGGDLGPDELPPGVCED